MGTPKVKKASLFRASLFETLKEVAEGQQHIVTHNAGDAIILISQTEFNKLLDEREFLNEVALGASQLDAGKGIPHKEALKKIHSLISKWK